MTFKKGDIVRLIREDNKGEPMRVLEVNNFANTTFVAIGNDDSEAHYDTDDLELFVSMPRKRVTGAFTPQEKIESCLSDIGCNIDQIRDIMRSM
jgi:hypothetical protein